MAEFRYFLVKGGKVRAAYDALIAEREQQGKARQALRKEFGAIAEYASDDGVEGLAFADPAKAPPTWVHMFNTVDTKKTLFVYKPNHRAKGGRALLQRMRGMKMARWRKFQTLVLGESNPFAFMVGREVYTMHCEKIGKSLILCVPIPHEPMVSSEKWTPPDKLCAPIGTSKYYALKEREAAKKEK